MPTPFNAINGQFIGNGFIIAATHVGSGNPNTNTSGGSFGPANLGDLYFDSTGLVQYICTTPGAAGTAVWASEAAAGSSFAWNNTTTTTQTMAVNNGYVSNNAAQSTFSLPTTAAVGQRVAVSGAGTGGFIIAQGTGQIIHVNATQATTSGAGGSITSSDLYDEVELMCVVANTGWKVQNVKGNPTYT